MQIFARAKRLWILLLIFAIAVLLFAVNAAKFLVVDSPQPSDLILVLAGETDHRPALGLDLLHRNFAPRMLLDVPAGSKIYNTTTIQVAENYLRTTPDSTRISICPIPGLSTREESHDVAACLAHESGRRILIVTSDYHTRRALSIFRHEIHGTSFSMAAAHDESQFGTRWWTHRQWAKTCFDEWLRFLWWSTVERWL